MVDGKPLNNPYRRSAPLVIKYLGSTSAGRGATAISTSVVHDSHFSAPLYSARWTDNHGPVPLGVLTSVIPRYGAISPEVRRQWLAMVAALSGRSLLQTLGISPEKPDRRIGLAMWVTTPPINNRCRLCRL